MSGAARATARAPRDAAARAAPAPFGLAVAVALLAGVLAVQRFPALPPFAAAVVLALAGLAAWLRPDRGRIAGAALLGIGLACAHGRAALDRQLPAAASGIDRIVEGRVLGLPQRSGAVLHFDFRVDAASGDGAGLVGRRLRLGWFAHPPATLPTVEAGSTWRLPVRLRPPRGRVNPGGPDFERRALEQRLVATGSITGDGETAVRLRPGRGLDRLRERLGERIALALPPERARFVTALALGDTRALSDVDWHVLRATGLTHLIAISGFHVGLVAGFGALLGRGLWWLWPALGRRWPRPQGAAAAALLLAFAYTALAGFALPTVRTLLMIAAALAARLARRPQRAQDAFAFALIAVLLADPLSVLAPGFWLSFLGVAWLIWCLPSTPGQGLVGPFLKAQGVAVLGLLPLTVWFFGQASLAGPLVNLVGIPWISLGVVPLCLLGLAAVPVSDVAAGTCWGMAAALMQGLWLLLERVAAWPASMASLPEPSLPALALALAGTLWCLLPRGVPGKPLAALLLLPLLWPRPDRPPPGEADLWLLDTGQGLSVLVRTTDTDLLYDAGPATPGGADLGETTVVPALHALSTTRLERLVISHGDSDHAGGAGAVRRALRPGHELAPPGWARGTMRPCLAGQHWQHDGVRFEVLHPPAFFPYLRNESSCVLRITAAGASALLPGDIGRHVEARLARLPAEAIRADVLLAPHHGSDSSSSLDFIAAVRPAITLIAVGRDNRFGLPRANVLARYDRYRAEVHDTAGSGAVHIRLGREGARVVERLRQDRRRYWRDAASAPTGYAGAGSGIER